MDWKKWLARGAVYFGILGLVLGVYMTWNYFTFGTPTPVSGQVKEWWGEINKSPEQVPETWAEFLGVQPLITDAPFALLAQIMTFFITIPSAGFYIPVAFLYLIATLILLRRPLVRNTVQAFGLIPLITGCLIQIWFYNLRGYVAMREWYWIAEMIFAVLGFAVLLNAIDSLIPKSSISPFLGSGLVIFLCLVTIIRFSRMAISLFPFEGSTAEDVLQVEKNIDFLENNTEPGSIIGMTGAGHTGYFVQSRTIVNLDGLINSFEYFQLSRANRGVEYLGRIGLKYIYARPSMLTDKEPYKSEFSGRLELLLSSDKLSLYRMLLSPQR